LQFWIDSIPLFSQLLLGHYDFEKVPYLIDSIEIF
jgi:hypothetical protein